MLKGNMILKIIALWVLTIILVLLLYNRWRWKD